jgi:lysophospholipase L1-like esterase
MALGDSLSAGYGAHPATQGFVYQLYQSGVIDNVNNMPFTNVGVPNATSSDILTFQVPQVGLFFADTGQSYRKVVTLTVGGNDLLQILQGAGDCRGRPVISNRNVSRRLQRIPRAKRALAGRKTGG